MKCKIFFSLLFVVVQVSFDGLTGKAQLREGNRHDPTLTFLKLKNRSLQPVGEWSLSKRLTVRNHTLLIKWKYVVKISAYEVHKAQQAVWVCVDMGGIFKRCLSGLDEGAEEIV